MELLLSLADVGATWAVLVPAGPSDRVELIAERVLPPIHSARGSIGGHRSPE